MLLDHIAARRSPRAFDPHAVLTDGEVDVLLEAARWAPSAMNRQPWSFLVGHRGDRTFQGIADTLNGNNQLWAPAASVLMVAMVETPEPADGADPGRAYELGLAMGQLGIQAQAMGLIVHQMGGFDKQKVRADFALPPLLHPMVAVAVGIAGHLADLPESLQHRELEPRLRRPLADLRHRATLG